MKTNQDTRWIQRFHNFKKSLAQLTKFINQDVLNELEEQGLIQCFEYNHELAWKTQKDFLEAQGIKDLFGSKTVAREAFKTGLIDNGEIWMQMIESRNISSHTYNDVTTKKIIQEIVEYYFDEFCHLEKRLNDLMDKQLNE